MHPNTSLTGKHIVDFLLVIELFSVILNIDWKSPYLQGVGLLDEKFHTEEDVPHQSFVHR